MKKLPLLLLVLSVLSNAQIVKKTFPYSKNTNYGINKSGKIYISREKELKIFNEKDFTEELSYQSEDYLYAYFVNEDASNILINTRDSKIVVVDPISLLFKSKDDYFDRFSLNLQGNLKGIPELSKKEKKLLKGEEVVLFYTNTDKISFRVEKSKKKKTKKEWKYFIYKRSLNSFKRSEVEFFIPEIESKEEILEFYLIDYDDDSFSIMTHTYDGFLKKDKDPSIQNTIVLKYNFEGKLLKNTVLTNSIDSSIFQFNPVGSFKQISNEYDVKTIYQMNGSYPEIRPNEQATGFVKIIDGFYYYYSFIGSKKSKYDSKLIVSKFDTNGKLFWAKEFELKEGDKTSFDDRIETAVLFTKLQDKICVSFSEISDDYLGIFLLDDNDGGVINDISFEDIKYNINNRYLYSSELTMTFKDVYSSKLEFDIFSIHAVLLKPSFESYLKSLKNTKRKLNVYSEFMQKDNEIVNKIINDKDDVITFAKF